MSKKLQLRFGALCPAIKDQLKEQDFLFGKDEVKYFQEDADAITRLRVRGYLPDSQLDKIRQKLVNRVSEHIESLNNMVTEKLKS